MTKMMIAAIAFCASTALAEPAQKNATPFWAGYMLVELESPNPKVVMLETDGDITREVLDRGVVLRARPVGEGWRFVLPANMLYSAVHIQDRVFTREGHRITSVTANVTGEMHDILQHEYPGHTMFIRAGKLDGLPMQLCARGVCGDLYKFVANDIAGCEGSRCGDFLSVRENNEEVP